MDNSYEYRRENLWKEFDGEGKVNVISYFLPRNKGSVEVVNRVHSTPNQEYTLVVDTKKVRECLNNKYRYKRTWKPYEVTNFSALEHYIVQAEKENSKKVLISKREYAMIQPTKRKQ